MPKKSEKPFVKSDYNRAWNKANYDIIKTTIPKYMDMPKTLDIAAQKAGISKAEYIRQAIIKQLKLDGFDVEVKAEHNDKETGNSDKE